MHTNRRYGGGWFIGKRCGGLLEDGLSQAGSGVEGTL